VVDVVDEPPQEATTMASDALAQMR